MSQWCIKIPNNAKEDVKKNKTFMVGHHVELEKVNNKLIIISSNWVTML